MVKCVVVADDLTGANATGVFWFLGELAGNGAMLLNSLCRFNPLKNALDENQFIKGEACRF